MESEFRQLLLCACDPLWQARDRGALVTMLRRLAVLGEPVADEQPGCYLIGDAFLQSFSFMGCAPSIEFEPSAREVIDWQAFIFIHLPQQSAQPIWLADEGAKPACPSCGQRIRGWRSHYVEVDGRLVCPGCGHRAAVCDWRWFDAGGCARQFISVVNVYPKEAMPTDALLQELQTETGTPWQYFYHYGSLLSGN